MAKIKEQPNLWERQPGEGPQAFRAFAAYRDSGIDGKRRSLTKTAQSLTKRDGTPYSPGTLKVWSQKHNWQMRVDAFDAEMDRQTQEELRRGRTAMLKNHLGIAQQLLKKAIRGMEAIPADQLTMQDITRIVETATKLERLSRGEATERTEGAQTITGDVRAEAVLEMRGMNLGALSEEELEQLDALVGKIAGD